MQPATAPRVSVIIPAYRSGATLPRALLAIAGQSPPPLEIIVVGSSLPAPDLSTLAALPVAVRYMQVAHRLYPHQARNYGAAYARGDLLLFTDPDIYPEPLWLHELVLAWQQTGAVVFGALACHGRRWLDIGAHFCKFHICLPGGPAHPIAFGWSGAMLIERSAFWAVGGFPDQLWAGDTMVSAQLRCDGYALWFVAHAVAQHDHEQITWRSLLRERYQRGREFGNMLAGESFGGAVWTNRQLLRHVIGSLFLPLQLLLTLARIARQAQAAGLLADYFWTLPVIVAGRAVWALGNATGYTDVLRRRMAA